MAAGKPRVALQIGKSVKRSFDAQLRLKGRKMKEETARLHIERVLRVLTHMRDNVGKTASLKELAEIAVRRRIIFTVHSGV